MAGTSTTERLTQLSNARVGYIRDIHKIPQLSPRERDILSQVAQRYPFRANTYYLGLIDWDDPDDPIRRIVIPDVDELESDGVLDPSDEAAVTVARGVEHKYRNTVLLLVSEVCGTYCRFCFRKRLFMEDNDEVSLDVSHGLDYLRYHPEVDNVLLTGGDALILGTGRLDRILTELRGIPHIRTIRIGTKMPAFNPYRVLDDDRLIETLARHSHADRRIHIMAHFNHPRELTEVAEEGLARLLGAGVAVVNQTPLLAGVNDDADVIAELFNRLSHMGVPPYYLFQGRPIEGNRAFGVPLRRGYRIYERAKKKMSGLAKRARYAMSHATGKVEIVGFLEGRIVFKYHQARNPDDLGHLFSLRCPPDALWLDDLTEGLKDWQPSASRRRPGTN